MINRLLDLTNKNDEFEQYLSSFEKFTTKLAKSYDCLSSTRNFSNLEIILPKRVLITKINATEKSKIFFQCLMDLSLVTSEEIEFSFIVNDISIYKSTKILQAGSNQVCVMQNYVPISSEELSIYIEINPINKRAVNLSIVSLFMWGKFDSAPSINYQALETNEGYLLSMIDNGCIYYKVVPKSTAQLSFSDFNYLDDAKDYSFAYSSIDSLIYYFRIDLNGNLFYSKFSSFYRINEIFINNNVSKVSCAISSVTGSVLVSYIKDGYCYYFEILNNTASIHKKLLKNNIYSSDCLCYYNLPRQKFCIIITSSNDTNYFIEQVNDDFSGIDNISASYSIYLESATNE